jgi:hypothetical protein
MSAFTSRQCDVCRNALEQAFSGIEDQHPKSIPHHRTKDSLVNSVMVQSCHLCRLVLYHLKVAWVTPPTRNSFFASAMLQNPLSLKWDSCFWAEEEAETQQKRSPILVSARRLRTSHVVRSVAAWLRGCATCRALRDTRKPARLKVRYSSC